MMFLLINPPHPTLSLQGEGNASNSLKKKFGANVIHVGGME